MIYSWWMDTTAFHCFAREIHEKFPIEPGTQRLVMWSCFVPVGSSCRACHRASGKSRTRRLSRKSDLEVSDNLGPQKRPRENASKNVKKNKTEQGGLLFKAIQSVIPITESLPRYCKSSRGNWHHPQHARNCRKRVDVHQVDWWGSKHPRVHSINVNRQY